MVSKVLVVDDSASTRSPFEQLLEGEHEVVGEAENGVETVELCRKLEPSVVAMGVMMPIRDGIEATSKIKSLDTDASVIMYVSVGQEERVREATEMGVDGYTTEPFQKLSVLQVITDVIRVEA